MISPERKNNSLIWIVKEVRFIKNIYPVPEHWYQIDSVGQEETISYALNNNLLPLPFHSHPTQGANLIFEAVQYHNQLNTSSPDKLHSLFSKLPIDESQLRLPEILVICNGQLKNEIFVGLYGGLIAPLDFSERKEILKTELSNKIFNSIDNFFTTPRRKLLGVLTASAFLYFLIKYPKSTLLTIATTATVLPSIAYTSGLNEFFGISYGLPLQISLPKIADELIISDEKRLIELFKEWEKKQYNRAA